MSAFLLEVAVFGALLGLPFLYEARPAFCYYLKFLLYYLHFSLSAVILIPVFMFRMRNVLNLITASYVARLITVILGIKWVMRNGERLEPQEPCIIVSNHQSALDVLGQMHLWPTMKRCTVIAKSELFYAWPFGLAAWLCGLVFIPRVKKDEAKRVLNEAAESIKETKTKLWIFPEGTRRNTGEIHDFKKGAFHAAISAQLPILPVVFSRYYFLDRATKKFDQGVVLMKTLEPISTKGKTLDDVDSVLTETREKMIHAFKEINQEVLANNNSKNLLK